MDKRHQPFLDFANGHALCSGIPRPLKFLDAVIIIELRMILRVARAIEPKNVRLQDQPQHSYLSLVKFSENLSGPMFFTISHAMDSIIFIHK
jgi:hypothetical protein